jgi:tyrocidine synthetase-3
MIAQKYEEQVKRTPHQVVARCQGSCLTYLELNRLANRIAHVMERLWPTGPGSGTKAAEVATVGLLFGHGVDMIAALMAALKAGIIYVHLPPDYPKNRLATLLTYTRSALIITNTACLDLARQLAHDRGIGFFNIDDVEPGESKTQENLDRPAAGDHLAYIMCTSGSTGQPKGVMQTHENVLYYIRNWKQRLSIDTNDRLTLFASFSHDASVLDMFGAILSGATLYPVDVKSRVHVGDLAAFLVKERITIWHSVPSLFAYFVQTLDERHEFKGLRFVLLGGEALREYEIKMCRRYFPHSTLVNVYGQTESSADSLWFLPAGEPFHKIVIGEPFDRTEIFLVDEEGDEADPLEIGEIVVTSPHLSPGYWQDPELTERTFTGDNHSGRLYWTGDLGRRLLNGDIEFLGRKDWQVKIRGFRVEPGEIESHLLRHPDVAETVVLAREAEGGEKYLCAYIVGSDAAAPDTAGLRAFLTRDLPDYMVPPFFVCLDRFPLTQGGKIDRKELPEPTIGSAREYAAPRSAVDRKMAEVWSVVLGVAAEGIGIDDDFFELGGHSLKATVLVSRLHQAFEVAIPLSRVFKTPTIRDLSDFIDRARRQQHADILPQEEREYYELSSSQKRLYLLQQLEPGSTSYNLFNVVSLSGRLDRSRLSQAFAVLIDRHQSLRTSFVTIHDEPVQRVWRQPEFQLEECGGPEDPVTHGFVRPFDLSRAPLLRVGLAPVGADRHLLMVDMHHIVSDGTSRLILMREFRQAMAGGEMAGLRIQYRDFAHWQNRLFAAGVMKRQQAFWLEVFAGDVPVLQLPSDFPRPPLQDFAGRALSFDLDIGETAGLNRLARQQGVTLYMVLLSVFNVFLSKLGGQEDIVVGTPIAGRRHADLEPVIGMFVNTLCMRNTPCGEATFAEFLGHLGERTLSAFENQDYPFEELVERVVSHRDMSRNPLFDVAFVLQNFMDTPGEGLARDIGGLKLAPYAFENRTSRFDLTLTAVERGETLSFMVEFCTRLFKAETIERFIGYFRNIVRLVLPAPETVIAGIDMIPDHERTRVLMEFNKTAAPYPRDLGIAQLFERQAQESAHHIAALGVRERAGGGDRCLSYRELSGRAHLWAERLHQQGVGPGTIVAITAERSFEMIIGLLAILKSGGAYLPIDPAYPPERIQFMLTDSGAGVLITARDQVIEIEERPGSGARGTSVHTGHLAYIIYTSGSTGRPKGTAVTHTGMFNTLYWRRQEYRLVSDDRVLQLFSFAFDGFVTSFFTPVISGSQVVMVTEEAARDIDRLRRAIVSRRVTHFICVPSLYASLLELCGPGELASLRIVTLAGEAAGSSLPEKSKSLQPQVETVNEYGATENTVVASICRDIRPGRPLTIGKPIANTGIYILDRYLRPVPIGVGGELCIAGAGVATGYLNNPDLTAEKFVSLNLAAKTREDTRSPQNTKSYILTPKSQILYRTGDLARFLADGNIEFLGRIDHQVKVRGFRIELGEIESRLVHHPHIREAAVIDRTGEDGETYLCAYIVPPQTNRTSETSRTNKTSPAKLRRYLAESLPAYMIPALFVPLANIPRTPNGKLDRRALPEPEIKTTTPHAAPANDREERMVEIWADVLGLDRAVVGVEDNFFELGGQSLKGNILMTRIRRQFQVEIPLMQLFKTPTVRGLCRFIGQSAIKDRYTSIRAVEDKEYYALSPGQKRLYFIQQMEPLGTGYNLSQAFRLTGELSGQRLETAFKELIDRHESLRTSFILLDETPVQRIHRQVDFTIGYENTGTGNLIKPFDLSRAPLLRVSVVKTGEQQHTLFVDIHHIISDEVSQNLLARDFMALYAGKELPRLKLRYRDYSENQGQEIQGGILKRQEAYWLKEFSGELPQLKLPVDYSRPSVPRFTGDVFRFNLGSEETDALREMAVQEGATLQMVMLAVLNILLFRLSGQPDIIIGTPTVGRHHADLENVIGIFINTIALRNFPAAEKTFLEFLREVRDRSLSAYENQDYPFDDLVKKVWKSRAVDRNPLFEVMFEIHNFEDLSVNMPTQGPAPLALEPLKVESRTTRLDLDWFGVETKQGIHFMVIYSTKLFDPPKIEKMARRYGEIVTQVLANREIKIGDIKIQHDYLAAETKILAQDQRDFGF